ncbi:hypothetical protein POVCU2_0016390 [Plasmodium ovale curtisi]|uniref:Uncharacterized protein n=1 Tax=Plasmodium ovale curtisi TaxID=864141 RepID=A0A1A8VQF3_PLAOA|nr:hypothetical protein POVCU2_0016390 [Plasmodium ovale curtisi]SBS87512.1 hypothetical protein POVCU1_014700 [Plasmodium ovale curtisi]
MVHWESGQMPKQQNNKIMKIRQSRRYFCKLLTNFYEIAKEASFRSHTRRKTALTLLRTTQCRSKSKCNIMHLRRANFKNKTENHETFTTVTINVK